MDTIWRFCLAKSRSKLWGQSSHPVTKFFKNISVYWIRPIPITSRWHRHHCHRIYILAPKVELGSTAWGMDRHHKINLVTYLFEFFLGVRFYCREVLGTNLISEEKAGIWNYYKMKRKIYTYICNEKTYLNPLKQLLYLLTTTTLPFKYLYLLALLYRSILSDSSVFYLAVFTVWQWTPQYFNSSQ